MDFADPDSSPLVRNDPHPEWTSMACTRQAERPWVNCSILWLYVRKLRRSISGYGSRAAWW